MSLSGCNPYALTSGPRLTGWVAAGGAECDAGNGLRKGDGNSYAIIDGDS